MPRARIQQVSFTGGQMDTRAHARVDISKYYSAAETMKNVVLQPLGGFADRPGLRRIAELPDWGTGGRILSFAFSTEQTYLHALTNGQFRVFKDDALVATVNAQPWNGQQAREMQWTQSYDTLLLFHKDVQTRKILRGATHADWTPSAVAFSNIPTYDYGAGAEAIISATRGWPRCGRIYQGRLYIGGLRSRPSTMLGSVVGQYFDLNKGTGLADQGINRTIDDDQVNAIFQIEAGRHLQIFTSGGSFANLVNPPVTPDNIALDRQSERGIEEFVPTVQIDGATLYAQRGGGAIREFVYADTEQAYNAELNSLLVPELIRTPVAMDVATATEEAGADYVYIVNSDGTVACLNTLRRQEIAGYTWFETDGKFRDVAALDTGETYFVVERVIDGVTRWFLEKLDRDVRLDAAKVYTAGFPIAIATGLDELEGKTVQIIRDGYVDRPQVVVGGQITLQASAKTSLYIGLDFDARVKLLPLQAQLADGTMLGKKSRTVAVTLRLHETAAIAVNGFAHSFRRFSLEGEPSLLASPPPTYTGDIRKGGLRGWNRRSQVEISRPFPGPMSVLGLVMEVAV